MTEQFWEGPVIKLSIVELGNKTVVKNRSRWDFVFTFKLWFHYVESIPVFLIFGTTNVYL